MILNFKFEFMDLEEFLGENFSSNKINKTNEIIPNQDRNKTNDKEKPHQSRNDGREPITTRAKLGRQAKKRESSSDESLGKYC